SGYYLVTPYEGRCTLNYINKVQGSLNVNNVMFYVLELVHALIYLHEHDVIVRNINTNSVMVDHQGHVLLQDFSLGEFGASSRMKDFDTVPVFYLAPEIIKYDTYSKAIDWWALGITIYSLMYGQEPFRDSNTFKTISCILTKEPEYPQKLNGTKLIALCKDLLIKRQELRLGSGPLGSLFVINHPCLVDVDWAKLSARKFRPPFLPPENIQLKQKPKDADNLTLSTSKSSLSEFQWSGDQGLAQEKTALNYLPFGLSTSFPKQEIGARRWCSSSNLSQFVDVSSRNIHRQTFIRDTIKELEAIRSQNSNLDNIQRRGKASEWHSHDVSVFRNTNLNHGPLDEPSDADSQSWFWMGAMLHGRMNAGLKGQGCEQALGVGEGAAAEGGDRAAPAEAGLECLSCSAEESRDLNRSSIAGCRNENGLREAESGQCDGSIPCDCVFHILFEWTPSDKMSERVVYSRNCTSHAAVNDLNTGCGHAAVNKLNTGSSHDAVNDLNTGSSHAAVNDLNTGSGHAAVNKLNTGSSHDAVNDLNTGSSHAAVNDLNTDCGHAAVNNLIIGSGHAAVNDLNTGSSHAAVNDLNTGSSHAAVNDLNTGSSHAAVNDLNTGSSHAAVNDLNTGSSHAAVNDLNTGSSHAAVNDLNTGSSHAAVNDLNTGSSHAAVNDLNTGSSHAAVNDLNTGSSHAAVDDTDTSHAAFADQNNSGLVQDSDNEVAAKENDQEQSLLDSTRKRGNINLDNPNAGKEMLLAESKLSFFNTDSSVSFDEEKCESGIDPLRQHNDDHRYQHIDTKLIKSLDQRKLFESKEVKDPCLRKDDALKSETSETKANQSCVITDQYHFTHTDCSGELMCAFNPLTQNTCQDVNTSDSPKSTFLDYVTRRLKDDPTCASPSNGHTKQSTNTSDCHHRETQIQQCRASNPTEYSSDSAAERGRIACGEDTFVSGFPAKLSLNEDHFKNYDKSFKNALFGGSKHNESSHSGLKTHFLKRLIFGKRKQKDHSCIHRKTSCQAGTHRKTSCQACTHSETSFESETLETFLTKSKPKKKFGFLSIRPRAESVRGTCGRKNNKTLTQPSKNECTDADYYQMIREKECIDNLLGTTSRSTCNLPEEMLQHLPDAENVKVDYCEDLKLKPIFSDNQRSITSDSNIPRSIISDSDCFHKNEMLICTGGLPLNYLELDLQMELDQTLQRINNTGTYGLGKGNDQIILDTNKVDTTLDNVDTQAQTILDTMRINGQTVLEKQDLNGQTILEKKDINGQSILENEDIKDQTILENEDIKKQMLLYKADINRQIHWDSVDNNVELLFDKQTTNELILLNCELKELSSNGVESVYEERETEKKAADEVNSFGSNECKTQSDVSEDNNESDSSHDNHDSGCKDVMSQSDCRDVMNQSESKDVMSQSDCKDVISQSDRIDVISQSDRKDIITQSDCKDVMTQSNCKDVMSQSGCFDVMRQPDCKDVMIKPYCKDVTSQSDCNKGDNEQGQCGTRQCEDQSTLNQDEDKSHSDCRDEQSQTKWKDRNTDSQEGKSQCADKQVERCCEEKTNEREVRLLDHVDVDNIDVDKADLDSVDLDNVDLDNVDLDNVDLDNIDLDNVDLDKVDLDNVDLDNVDLDNVDLDNVAVDNVGQTQTVETQIERHLDNMDDSIASLISGSASFETAAMTFNVSPDSTSGSPAFVTADATFDSGDDHDLKEICTSHSTINPNPNFIPFCRSTSSHEGTSESGTGRVLPLGHENNESLGSVQSEADTLNPLFVMTSDNGENGTGKYGTGSDLLIPVDGKPEEETSKHGQDARLTSLKQGNDAYDQPNSGEINLMADDMTCPQSLIGTDALTSGVTEKHLFSTNNEAHQNETNGDKSIFSSLLDKSGGRVVEMTSLKTETGNPRDAADDGLSALWRSTPYIAQPSVDAPMMALSRARQMMRELDEITPYSESDFWRRGERRQSRFRRDAPDFFSGGFYGDSVCQDQGRSDDGIQVIGTLTIEYLTPPVNGLIFEKRLELS
ncbi:tetra-peptide repeat homeobox protein 1, partial [Biomphalaria glabrata]